MPVTPQEFSLWARMTGNKYPNSVEEKVRLAPEVHNFSQNVGKQGALGVEQEPEPEQQSNLGSKLAKGALIAGGIAAGVAAARNPGVQEAVKTASGKASDFLSKITTPREVNVDTAEAVRDVTNSAPGDVYSQAIIPVSQRVGGYEPAGLIKGGGIGGAGDRAQSLIAEIASKYGTNGADEEYVHPSRIPGMPGGDYRGRRTTYAPEQQEAFRLTKQEADERAILQNEGEIPPGMLTREQQAYLKLNELGGERLKAGKQRSAERDLEGQQRAESLSNKADAIIEASGESGVSPKFDANQLSELSNLIESYEMGIYANQSPNDGGMSAWQRENPNQELSNTPAEYDKLAGLLATAGEEGKERTLNTKSAQALDGLLTNLQNTDQGAYGDYGALHSDVGRVLGRTPTHPNRQDIDIEDKRQYEIATQGNTNIKQPFIFRDESKFAYDSNRGVYEKEQSLSNKADAVISALGAVDPEFGHTQYAPPEAVEAADADLSQNPVNTALSGPTTPGNNVPTIKGTYDPGTLTGQQQIQMAADNAVDELETDIIAIRRAEVEAKKAQIAESTGLSNPAVDRFVGKYFPSKTETYSEVDIASGRIPERTVPNIGPEAGVTKAASGTSIRGRSRVQDYEPSRDRQRDIIPQEEPLRESPEPEQRPDIIGGRLPLGGVPGDLDTSEMSKQEVIQSIINPSTIDLRDKTPIAGTGVYGTERGYVSGAMKASGEYSDAAMRRPTELSPAEAKYEKFSKDPYAGLSDEALQTHIQNARPGSPSQQGLQREAYRRSGAGIPISQKMREIHTTGDPLTRSERAQAFLDELRRNQQG